MTQSWLPTLQKLILLWLSSSRLMAAPFFWIFRQKLPFTLLCYIPKPNSCCLYIEIVSRLWRHLTLCPTSAPRPSQHPHVSPGPMASQLDCASVLAILLNSLARVIVLKDSPLLKTLQWLPSQLELSPKPPLWSIWPQVMGPRVRVWL